jgi:TrmH family RNA methyltransferase
VDAVVRSEDTADFFNPKVVQATMGSMVNVKLATMSLEALKTDGIPIYGTFMDGEDVGKATIEKGAILVMGSEGRGISNQYKLMIDRKLTIPGVQGKIAESLNVAVAAGIVCAAWRR